MYYLPLIRKRLASQLFTSKPSHSRSNPRSRMKLVLDALLVPRSRMKLVLDARLVPRSRMKLVLVALLVLPTVLGSQTTLGGNSNIDMDKLLESISSLLGVSNSIHCTLVVVGNVPVYPEIPVLFLSNESDLKSIMGLENEFNYITPSNCWIGFINKYTEENRNLLYKVQNILKSIPKFVMVNSAKMLLDDLTWDRPVNWVNIVDLHYLYIRCAECSTVYRGYWDPEKNRVSSNLEKYLTSGLCCNPHFQKELRVSYTTFPPYFEMPDVKNLSTLNTNTLEYYYLSLFLEKNRMTVSYRDANFQWGAWVNATNSWNGVVGDVGYNLSDLGISSMGYSAIRQTHVDYTHHLLPMHFRWISKAPGKVAPYKNFILCFDPMVWLGFISSLIAMSLAVAGAVKVGQLYGMQYKDTYWALFVPMAYLSQEGDQKMFNSAKNNSGRGFSGNFLLLNWGLTGMLLTFAYSSNLLALLTKAEYGAPINNMEDVVKSGQRIQVAKASWIQGYLSTSGGYWEQKASEKLLNSTNERDGKDISYRTTIDFYGRFISGDPRYSKLPKVHFSKEIIRPYYTGWVVQKISNLLDPMNMHILRMHQAGLVNKPVDFILHKAALIEDQDNEDKLEPLSVQNLIGIFIVYIAGMGISFLAYTAEILILAFKSDWKTGEGEVFKTRGRKITTAHVASLIFVGITTGTISILVTTFMMYI
ncbi:uncharacterized protein LOC111700771 [Eurytemora carolleeae]|uniref:uncharacterized protein LOC111700771 n=1 Tax=Eurytemora carolleeae TaxID=1294199 RepID=UPI000C75AF23|nr:uncharacterized protein LOC111700771 [Eurytemora carolleeae]|eukprot:XP_023327576.1 uncharacterized protein LOC111700771 [Eurytemora affinis]